MNIHQFRELALSLPGVEEKPHFDTASLRWKERIFATWHSKDNKAMLKLTPVEQSVYIDYDAGVFQAVPGSWGAKGATFVALDKVNEEVFAEALQLAYTGTCTQKTKRK